MKQQKPRGPDTAGKVSHRQSSRPHPNAPVARAFAGDADFSSDHLPGGGWRYSDARDGRVLLKRSVLPTDSVLELAVYDPFTRGHTLLPPIPDNLVASVFVPVSNDRVLDFQALLLPSRDYEDAHFKVVGLTCDEAMAVVFIYSSLSGTWALGTAATWDALGLNVNLLEPDDWFHSYVYGCFYWHVLETNKLLKLNIDRMEFSAVGLPPDYANRSVFAVEAGEGRVGIFTRTFAPNVSRDLQYSIRQNEGENVIEHSKEATILLPSYCKSNIIVAAAEGYVFIVGGPSSRSGLEFFTLEIKTLKVERLCSPIGRRWTLSYSGYFGYPRFLSPRRI